MAAFVKAGNANIRPNPVSNHFCSTPFWGPASNFTIALAAIADIRKSPELISPPMTGSLIVYACVFMRYSLAVTPKNYLLFACHFINFGAQTTQGCRYMDWHHWSGKDEAGIHPSVKVVKSEVGVYEEVARK